MAATRAFAAAALALALLVCCAPSSVSASDWKFCAPEGGHCQCFGEMRFGHPGLDEHLAEDGKFFKEHPEVSRWSTIHAKGLKMECSLELFGAEEKDPFPSELLGESVSKFCQCRIPEELVWKHCAEAGEECACNNVAASYADSPDAASEEGSQAESGDKDLSHRAYLVRATDQFGGYYGVQAVKDVFTCPNDYPGASCECLTEPDLPELKWNWCANEGGKCPCETRMRYGSSGTDEMYKSGYFKENPDVKKWVEKEIIGDVGVTKCDAVEFDGVDPFPDQEKICQCMMPVRKEDEKVLAWKWCANEGGECECQSAARFGNTGDPDEYNERWFENHREVKKWHIRGDAPGNISCQVSSFDDDGEDPFPGRKKICQCLREIPRALTDAEVISLAMEVKHKDWTWCGNDGSTCNCDGLVRYGSTGEPHMYDNRDQWFKEHPEVMKWTFLKSYGELECSIRTFSFDPFPNQKKICQCYDGFNDEFPYQLFRPAEAALGGPGDGGYSGLGSASHAARSVVAQVIRERLRQEDAEQERTNTAPRLSAMLRGDGDGSLSDAADPAAAATAAQASAQEDSPIAGRRQKTLDAMAAAVAEAEAEAGTAAAAAGEAGEARVVSAGGDGGRGALLLDADGGGRSADQSGLSFEQYADGVEAQAHAFASLGWFQMPALGQGFGGARGGAALARSPAAAVAAAAVVAVGAAVSWRRQAGRAAAAEKIPLIVV